VGGGGGDKAMSVSKKNFEKGLARLWGGEVRRGETDQIAVTYLPVKTRKGATNSSDKQGRLVEVKCLRGGPKHVEGPDTFWGGEHSALCDADVLGKAGKRTKDVP